MSVCNPNHLDVQTTNTPIGIKSSSSLKALFSITNVAKMLNKIEKKLEKCTAPVYKPLM